GPSVPVSVALGETAEWGQERPLPKLPTQIAYMKLGTAGLQSDVPWPRRLSEVRERFSEGGAGLEKWGGVASEGWEGAWGALPGRSRRSCVRVRLRRGPDRHILKDGPTALRLVEHRIPENGGGTRPIQRPRVCHRRSVADQQYCRHRARQSRHRRDSLGSVP